MPFSRSASRLASVARRPSRGSSIASICASALRACSSSPSTSTSASGSSPYSAMSDGPATTTSALRSCFGGGETTSHLSLLRKREKSMFRRTAMRARSGSRSDSQSGSRRDSQRTA